MPIESESVPFSRGERLGERSCIKYLRSSAGRSSSQTKSVGNYLRKSAGNFSIISNKICAHLRFKIPQNISVNLRETSSSQTKSVELPHLKHNPRSSAGISHFKTNPYSL
jgi:hypothetical protein